MRRVAKRHTLLRRSTDSQVAALWRRYLAAVARDIPRLESRHSDSFPHYGEGGRWTWLSVDAMSGWDREGVYEHGNWTAGFTLGSLALLENAIPGSVRPELVGSRTEAVSRRSDDTTTHDLGFLFFPGHVFGSELGVIGPSAKGHALQAAASLIERFNESGGYIQAFGRIGDPRSAGTSTIDTMMNLPLLWWAGVETGEPRFYEVARRHARTTARLFLRPDASTYHLLHFDSISGALLSRGTFQGASDSSCWSRGQAWAVSGFAWAYAVSAEVEFLRAAEGTADTFCRLLPKSGIPAWDFSDDSEEPIRDSSATAIAALGILILAEVHPESHRREAHRRRAEKLLAALGSCLSASDEGVLQNSCYSLPSGLGTRGAVAWGDFYLGLALGLAERAIDVASVMALPVEHIRAIKQTEEER